MPNISLFPPVAGYTVTSVVSSRQGRVYVAGAPRFNHTGKVILFTMHNNRSLTIHQALRGQQVMEGEPGAETEGRGADQTNGRAVNTACLGHWVLRRAVMFLQPPSCFQEWQECASTYRRPHGSSRRPAASFFLEWKQ